MKYKKIFSPLLAILILFFQISCNKIVDCKTCLISPEIAPIANAGPDIRLEIPATSITIQASAHDDNDDIRQYNWRKISGPSSYFLEWPYNISPRLGFLEEGEYEFEFLVTDTRGLIDKDSVKITVATNLRKHVLTNLSPDSSQFTVAQIPTEVKNNIKWVFGKAGGYCQRADAGPFPGIDYAGGGYFYELLSGDRISVFGGNPGQPLDLIIYY